MKDIKWNGDRFTRRQLEQIAYGVLMRMVARMEHMPKEEREGAELALADLIGQVPAYPSLATATGLDYIDVLKQDIADIRQMQEVERRKKLKPAHPLASAAREQSPELADFALVMMRRYTAERPMRLPRRSF